MKFLAYTKDANGEYTVESKIQNTVFPFSSSALLDERLNEAILYVYTNEIELYKPTTEIKVVADDGTNTKEYYYIVSSDISQELPNGSGRYKHEIHLLERTKLLEGIYCQSLCFTNPKGNVYTNNPLNVRPTQPTTTFPYYSLGEAIEDLTTNLIVSPVPLGEKYKTPTPTDMFNLLSAYYPQNEWQLLESWKPNTEADFVYTGISVENGTDSQNSNGTNVFVEIDAKNPLVITYTLIIAAIPISSTFAFKFTYTINAVQNQYPLKPWTIPGCVNRCLDLAEPIFKEETPRFTFNSEQVKKYSSVFAPEFSMTECTLREQLKVIGSYIHAEPRLTEDDEIAFDEYGIGEEAKIASMPYVFKQFTRDINEYCTHIETSAKNLVNSLDNGKGTVTEPNYNGYRTLRTDNVNVMLSETNAFANTDNKIYDIPNGSGAVFVTLYNDNNNDNNNIYTDEDGFKFENIDITPYIFESHEYANLSSYDSTYPYSKSFALYYTRGEKGIRGLFFKNENAIDQYFSDYTIVNIINAVTGKNVKGHVTDQFPRIAFKITYTPIYDTKFSHSKQTVTLGELPFMRVYNQSENTIEAKAYGENIKGVAQRMGNAEQTRTYILNSLNDIPKVAQTIDGYFIVEVKTEIQANYIKCTVQLTKDFNRISQYIGINSNKRVFEVSEANTYARDILLKNYVVVSDTQEIVNTENTIFNSLTPILQIFNPSIAGGVSNPINAVNAYSYSKNGTNSFGNVILPVISSAFGNTMVFSWDYKDNYSAGESVSQYIGKNAQNQDVKQVWQTDVPYGDYYGRAYRHRFYLLPSPISNYSQANTVESVLDQSASSSPFGTQKELILRKDSRERISMNCELEFVTTQDDIIIGSALASSCPLVTSKRYGEPVMVFLTGKVGKFEKNLTTSDARIVGYYTINPDNVGTDGLSLPLTIEYPPNNFTFDSWAIITPIITTRRRFEDEDGNVEFVDFEEGGEILLARNKSKDDYDNDNDGEGKTTETITFKIARTIYN